jgi:hypothetical protein
VLSHSLHGPGLLSKMDPAPRANYLARLFEDVDQTHRDQMAMRRSYSPGGPSASGFGRSSQPYQQRYPPREYSRDYPPRQPYQQQYGGYGQSPQQQRPHRFDQPNMAPVNGPHGP